MTRRPARLILLVLGLLAVAGLLLQTGSLPHAHDRQQTGLYNQEHDLTLLASLAAQANAVAAAPGVVIDAVSVAVAPLVPEHAPAHHARSDNTRAPPSA
jgi:hypothetical protein